MENIFTKNTWVIAGVLLAILVIPSFFDKGLSVGLGLLMVLSGITFLILYKLGFRDKNLYLLFFIALLIHLGATLLMHYTNFQPFSGGQGDNLFYQKEAIALSERFKEGNFSLKDFNFNYPDLYVKHYYPVVVGFLYAFTMPKEVIGLMLNVWLAAITIALIYIIILDIKGSKRSAFLVGLIVAVYPSYIFNSGLLLKDPMEIFFIVSSLMFIVKMIKKFSWYTFFFLYIAMVGSTHFRFYIGYALILTFVVSWFFFSKMDLKKRILYGIIFIIVLGFVPQIAVGQGYYGITSVKTYLNSKIVTFYRQVAYNPAYYQKPAAITPATTKPVTTKPVTAKPVIIMPSTTKPVTTTPATTTPITDNSTSTVGMDSSFVVANGPIGYVQSFVDVLLGPFPWQIKKLRQSFALVETIPWYIVLFFVVDGIIICFKNRIKEAIPLLMFSIIVITTIAVFDSNFGLIVRIRIPAFMALLCLSSLSFNRLKYLHGFKWLQETNS